MRSDFIPPYRFFGNIFIKARLCLFYRSFLDSCPSYNMTKNGKVLLIIIIIELDLFFTNQASSLPYSTVEGTGLQSRHFLYVDDLTEAFLIVMERGILGEIYNIGANFEIPIIQLARQLVQLVGSKCNIGIICSSLLLTCFYSLADSEECFK